MHTHTHTHSSPLSSASSWKHARATHTHPFAHIFRDQRKSWLQHFSPLQKSSQCQNDKWGIMRESVHTYIRLHKSCNGVDERWFQMVFCTALRLLLLHTRSQHANYMPRQWLAMWNYYQRNKNIFNTTGARGVWPDIMSGWMGGNVVFLIQVLAGKRLIANFPEVNTAHRCVWRTSDRPSDCWCRAAWGYFQTSFITSFQHQLQNGGGKIDGWWGLVNMRDWNDTQTVLFVVVRVTAQKMKKTGSRIYRININSSKADIDM